MVINTNLSAQAASTRLMQSSAMLAQSLQRLSSGSKIISPADDSAGLAVSMKLNSQVARLNAASSNIENAISFSQTQDGYLQKVSDAMNRMGELAVESMDVTKTDADRTLYDAEYQNLGDYVTTVAHQVFNGVSLFSANSLNVTADGESGTFAMSGVDSTPYTSFTWIDGIQNANAAKYSLGLLKNASDQLAKARAIVGSNEESLNFYHNQLAALKNNLSAANSQITDVDVAQESTNYAKENILVQSGTAMLAQANLQPQSALKLLG